MPNAASPANASGAHLFSLKWMEVVRNGGSGFPVVPVEFVAEQGRALCLVDVREREEMLGVLGHIPGSISLPLPRIAELVTELGTDVPVVLVSRGGERAGRAARYLEALGVKRVAALAGGILAWRASGYSVSRQERSLSRTLASVHPEPESSSGPMTRQRIEEHVGDPSQVRWVRLAALLVNGKRSCVDGRDDQGVVGTPGGDAGELVLALGCVERVTGKTLDDAAVQAILGHELDTFGRFYMHSDTTAWGKFVSTVQADPRLTKWLPTGAVDERWFGLLRSPPVEARQALLEQLEQRTSRCNSMESTTCACPSWGPSEHRAGVREPGGSR